MVKLKDKLWGLQLDIDNQINRLEKDMENKYSDVKVITTKLQCLESFKREVEEIIAICNDRNRY